MKKKSLVHGDSYSKERFSVRHEISVKKKKFKNVSDAVLQGMAEVWFSTAATSFISPGPNRVRSLTT